MNGTMMHHEESWAHSLTLDSVRQRLLPCCPVLRRRPPTVNRCTREGFDLHLLVFIHLCHIQLWLPRCLIVMPRRSLPSKVWLLRWLYGPSIRLMRAWWMQPLYSHLLPWQFKPSKFMIVELWLKRSENDVIYRKRVTPQRNILFWSNLANGPATYMIKLWLRQQMVAVGSSN